ncbi:hypothetical protein BANRA_04490 [Escherichia coli]|nr:hypothetical protein BANRA_04490 [Escherichia coli]
MQKYIFSADKMRFSLWSLKSLIRNPANGPMMESKLTTLLLPNL